VEPLALGSSNLKVRKPSNSGTYFRLLWQLHEGFNEEGTEVNTSRKPIMVKFWKVLVVVLLGGLLLAWFLNYLLEHRAAVRGHSATNLVASMTDEQILRAIGNNPDKLVSSRNDGKDGYSTTYSNETTLVFVTRSIVSGVNVLRVRPEEQKQDWLLGKP